MPDLRITRVVLYKHGVGYFEREGKVTGSSWAAVTRARPRHGLIVTRS